MSKGSKKNGNTQMTTCLTKASTNANINSCISGKEETSTDTHKKTKYDTDGSQAYKNR